MEDVLGDFLENIEVLETIEELTNRRLLARPRLFRERPDYFTKYDDTDFLTRYRLSKDSVIFLLDKIEHSLEYPDDRNQSVPPIKQLLCALRFFATGSHLRTVADIGGISISTSCRIIKRVAEAIANLQREFIKFPESEQEQLHVKTEFHRIAGFPNVVGCIDCTHIKIQSPGGDDAELFRNRKGYMSINVQTISAPNLLITDVVARWPGSTHDSTIYQNSRRYAKFNEGLYRGSYLLGDSGYPLKDHLLTPYLNPDTDGKRRYNEAHIKTRNIVERQYGLLKRRFPILALGLRLQLKNAINVIIACCVLHNICILRKENDPINDQSVTDLESLIRQGQVPALEIVTNHNDPFYGYQRNQVTNYFESLDI